MNSIELGILNLVFGLLGDLLLFVFLSVAYSRAKKSEPYLYWVIIGVVLKIPRYYGSYILAKRSNEAWILEPYDIIELVVAVLLVIGFFVLVYKMKNQAKRSQIKNNKQQNSASPQTPNIIFLSKNDTVQETQKDSKKCPFCGKALFENAKYCQSCGKQITPTGIIQYCSVCGNPITSDMKFCNQCGSQIR